MLYFKRDNDRVILNVETDLAHDCKGEQEGIIPFAWQCQYPYVADVLCRYLKDRLSNSVEDARREAYQQGWADAKAHRAKRTAFSAWL